MPSSGPNNPGTLADDATVGTVTWTNPGNAASSNDTYATAALSISTSHYLKATNFGFTIPAGATIDGIEVTVEHKGSSLNRITDNSIRLYKNGTGYVGDNKAFDSWSSADEVITYGGAADGWNASLSAADVNDAGFGVGVSATTTFSTQTGSIDHITVKVYYTEQNQQVIMVRTAGMV